MTAAANSVTSTKKAYSEYFFYVSFLVVLRMAFWGEKGKWENRIYNMFKSFLIWVLFSIGQMLGMSFGVYGIRRKQRRHVLSNWIIPWCYMHTLRPLRYIYTTLDSFLIQFRPTVRMYTRIGRFSRCFVALYDSQEARILFEDVCLCKTIHVTARLYAHGRK